MIDLAPPSDWVRRWSHLARPGATVLDLACGSGRHMAWFASRGHAVTGVDRSAELLARAQAHGRCVQADVENGPWPLRQGVDIQRFDVVVVTNYLWRPLWPTVLQSLAPDGLLLYETFAVGQERIGRPRCSDFLLQPGELLRLCQDLQVVAYEDGVVPDPPRCVQRIAALQPAGRAPSQRQREPLWLE